VDFSLLLSFLGKEHDRQMKGGVDPTTADWKEDPPKLAMSSESELSKLAALDLNVDD